MKIICILLALFFMIGIAAAEITNTNNHLPEITLFEPVDGSTFEEGSIISVNVAATDADGDSLSYIIEIDGVQVSTATSYSWATDYESAGTHTIKVTVSDGTYFYPRWDVNEDGIVNTLDITLVGQNYGATYTENPPRWDVNQDGVVNLQDLSIVSAHFGETVTLNGVSSSSTITITNIHPRWDVNEDGIVNTLDITLVGQNIDATYTENPPRWDVNQDGVVNIQDLSIVSSHFGEIVTLNGLDALQNEIPEFPTIAFPMAAIIGLAFIFRKRE